MLDDLAALVPPVGVALLFWFVMRAMLHSDRRERAAMAALDREAAQRHAAAVATPVDDLPPVPGGRHQPGSGPQRPRA